MLTIWGRMSSVNVQKAVLSAEETGVAYARKEAGGQFGVVDTEDYRAKNPNGLVPLLEDGDFILWESHVIVRYLCARYGGALYPADVQMRARAEQWMDWLQTSLQPAMGPAFMNLVRVPPERRNMGAAGLSLKKTHEHLAMLDAALARSDWLSGGAYSMAEIALLPGVHRALNLPAERPSFPHLERWYEAAMGRPAPDKVLTLPLT